MPDSKNEREGKRRWSPDSWIKVILVGSISFSFALFVTVGMVRALIPAYGISSDSVLEVFEKLEALLAVALGYVLGKEVHK